MTETNVLKRVILIMNLSSAWTNTVDWIVRTTGLSHRQVWGALRDLEDRGLATRMKSGWRLADMDQFPPDLQMSIKDVVEDNES